MYSILDTNISDDDMYFTVNFDQEHKGSQIEKQSASNAGKKKQTIIAAEHPTTKTDKVQTRRVAKQQPMVEIEKDLPNDQAVVPSKSADSAALHSKALHKKVYTPFANHKKRVESSANRLARTKLVLLMTLLMMLLIVLLLVVRMN